MPFTAFRLIADFALPIASRSRATGYPHRHLDRRLVRHHFAVTLLARYFFRPQFAHHSLCLIRLLDRLVGAHLERLLHLLGDAVVHRALRLVGLLDPLQIADLDRLLDLLGHAVIDDALRLVGLLHRLQIADLDHLLDLFGHAVVHRALDLFHHAFRHANRVGTAGAGVDIGHRLQDAVDHFTFHLTRHAIVKGDNALHVLVLRHQLDAGVLLNDLARHALVNRAYALHVRVLRHQFDARALLNHLARHAVVHRHQLLLVLVLRHHHRALVLLDDFLWYHLVDGAFHVSFLVHGLVASHDLIHHR